MGRGRVPTAEREPRPDGPLVYGEAVIYTRYGRHHRAVVLADEDDNSDGGMVLIGDIVPPAFRWRAQLEVAADSVRRAS